MDIIPPSLAAELAEQEQAEAADSSATRVRNCILAQPDFAVTPEWLAQIAAALSGKVKCLPEKQREIAQNYLDDLSDDMRGAE